MLFDGTSLQKGGAENFFLRGITPPVFIVRYFFHTASMNPLLSSS
jgi:hypothetical protein